MKIVISGCWFEFGAMYGKQEIIVKSMFSQSDSLKIQIFLHKLHFLLIRIFDIWGITLGC